MSVLDRSALEESPLADLHAIAAELGIDGFRRLRKAALVDAILERQGGDGASAAKPEADTGTGTEAEADEKPARKRGARGGRSRRKKDEPAEEKAAAPEEEGTTDEGAGDERVADGVVELLGNGSGFLRVSPPDPSDDDVYISAAQVRRCELVSGDRVTGPVRPPRRSERYPSLVRIDTINDRPADEVSEGTHFEDLPAAFPAQRFELGDEPTLKAIEWLTPIGRGSRVTLVGGPRAGKTEALKRLAGVLAGQEGLSVTLVLAGARPEELSEWRSGPVEPSSALTLGASPDSQAAAIERCVETAKRIAARGGDAVVLVDSLEALPPHAARKVLAAARNIVDGGSLTIVAAAPAPVGGETTVVALDPALTASGRFPALDLAGSGTLRPELLVGDAGAEAIAQARAAALPSSDGE